MTSTITSRAAEGGVGGARVRGQGSPAQWRRGRVTVKGTQKDESEEG